MLVFVLIMIFILQSSRTLAEGNENTLIYENEEYSVEITYEDHANIPKDSYLLVNEICEGTKEYDEYFTITETSIEQKRQGKVSSANYFDINIMYGDKKIEPDEAVDVSVKYKEGILKESKKNLEVIHFVNDTENEFLNITEEKTEKQIVEEIAFEQESFSVIGLIIFEGVDTSVKKIRSERISDIYAINIKKEWSDGIQEHEDDEVILTLYEADHNKSNWQEKRDVILNSENKWSNFVDNLDKNKDYSIGETKVMSENLEKTDAYQSEISVSVTKKWMPAEKNVLKDGQEILLIFHDGKDKLLRKSSKYDDMNLRMYITKINNDSTYGEYVGEEVNTVFVWKLVWDEQSGKWGLYHTMGEAYLELLYEEATDSYKWVTNRERTEGTYLNYEDGKISATVNGVTKYLGGITESGPYEGLDKNDSKIVQFEIFEYRGFKPAECTVLNVKNKEFQEEEIQADIITEKTIDYLGDGINNPFTDVDDTEENADVLMDLYRINLNLEIQTDMTGLDLLMVIDVSSSMKGKEDARDENGNYIKRSEALRQALNQFVPSFLQNNKRNRLSIVAFERDSVILQEWTNNSDEIMEIINYEENGEMPLYNGEGTDYEAALSRAHEALSKRGYSTNAKAMIFLSDGQPTVYIDGNDDIEPGNVTINTGSSALGQTGIEGTLPSGMKYIWNNEGALQAADEAIQSFKKHNPEIMIGAIAFNTIITDTLKNLATDKVFVTQIENGTPKDLINAMKLITEFVPKRVIVTDELSENVEIYKDDPDYRISVTDNHENEEILYTSDMGLTEKGKTVLDNSEAVIEKEGKIQMRLNENYIVEDKNTYSLSFNVNASQKAFDKYADSKGSYTDVGDKGTDCAGNSTSSGKEGFYSNGDNTKVKYNLNGAEIEKKYRKPVVQAREGTLSVKKTDIHGNIIRECAEFALCRRAENDEEGEYTLVAEAKTDEDGEILFEHLRLAVFDAGYTYYLEEKTSPEGYVKIDKPIEISLYKDDVRVNSTNKFVTTEKKVMEDGSLVGQVIIRNAKNVDFKFIKIEAGNENNKLNGAEFMLYELICREENHNHGNDCWKYITKKSSNPEVLFENLSSAAVYKLVETKAPDQYVLPDGYWIISVDDNNNIHIGEEGRVPDFSINEKGEWLLENEKMIDIPVTGGSGNIRFFIFGIMLITGGIFMTRKRNFSKLMMIIMALIMCFQSFSVTAFAIDSTDRGSITVNGVEENVSVKAYKLMNVNYDYEADQPKNPVYQWEEGVAGWVKEKHGDYIDTENNNAVEDVFSEEAEGSVALFYDELAVAIKEGNVTVDEVTVKANGDTVTISDLEMGNYFLLIEGGSKVYRPLTANVVPEWKDNSWQMSQPVVEAKASAPSITKTMKEEMKKDNADIGDILTFELVAVVPAYPDNAKAKKYIVSDQLSDGLSLVQESVKVYGMNSGKEDVLMESGYEKVTKRPVNTEDNQVSFALDFSYDEIKSFESLKITYDTVLNENAMPGETGNKNNAYLDYSNNPYIENDYSTDDDTVTVYTYGLKINKIDEDTNESLGGAEFTLSKDDEEIKFIGENGNYRVAKNGENGSSVVKVNENGMLVLRGLDADTYSLVEVKAPDGYVKLQHPVEVVIADENMDGIAEAGNQEFSDGYIPVTVKNDAGFTLPVTGGMGTTLFNIAGIVLMASGLTLIIVYLRKKNNYR